jgi:[ribosomal protein S5]-alanine N-acetyltransferase
MTPIGFYLKNGFEILTQERIDSEMIKAVKIKNNVKIYAETERLILREIIPSDMDGMFELDSDPEVHKYLGNKPVTDREQIINVINSIRQQYTDNGIGRWAIIDKKTNDFIGWTGLKFVTDLTNNHQNYYDLGYRLIKKYWRQGIATETAIISLNYAFEQLKAKEVYAMADCENDSSNKILKKVGLNFIEKFDLDGIKHNWYKIDKNDYEKNKKQNR